MKKTPQEIADEINLLVGELVHLTGGKKDSVILKKSISTKDAVGATGGLRMLTSEGYFDSPQDLKTVMEKLRQEGRHYSRQTVAMGLLALVRERILTRFRERDSKNWQYAKRK